MVERNFPVSVLAVMKQGRDYSSRWIYIKSKKYSNGVVSKLIINDSSIDTLLFVRGSFKMTKDIYIR
jgi:hypothetical protein